MKIKDLSGQKFGRLTVISKHGKNKWGNVTWICKCDCGKEHIVASGKLVQRKTKSCGCLANEIHIKQLETHGITTGGKPRTFTIWNGMKSRCLNIKSINYKNYGGRGITICNEWLKFENFHNWALQNGYSDNLQIDRINNNGNYEPSNCRWVSKNDNLKNQRTNHYISANGETKTITEWIKILKLPKSKIYKIYKENGDDGVSKYIENS